jgi:hypothetical protein
MTAPITIVLLNYRRPGNIPVILESISRQTVRPVVFLWNNGVDDVKSDGIDRYERSPGNLGCIMRWRMACEADTPYVMSLDDDLCFARDDALADIVESLNAMDHPGRVVGPFGCRFGNDADYTERVDVFPPHVAADAAFESVDMIKGRALALRRDRLAELALPLEREDDIFLCAAMAEGRRGFHRVPRRLVQAFRELSEHDVGNWTMPGHLDSRSRAVAAYFGLAPPAPTD